jgi:hypothetical protein
MKTQSTVEKKVREIKRATRRKFSRSRACSHACGLTVHLLMSTSQFSSCLKSPESANSITQEFAYI